MRFCNECTGELICDKCINRTNKNKEFEANFSLLKKEARKQFGYMLPYFEEEDNLLVKVRFLYTLLSFFSFYMCWPNILTLWD